MLGAAMFLSDEFLNPVTVRVADTNLGERRVHDVFTMAFTVHPLGHHFLRTTLTHGNIFSCCHEGNTELLHHVKWRAVRWAVVVKVVVVRHVRCLGECYFGQGRIHSHRRKSRFGAFLVHQISDLLGKVASLYLFCLVRWNSRCDVLGRFGRSLRCWLRLFLHRLLLHRCRIHGCNRLLLLGIWCKRKLTHIWNPLILELVLRASCWYRTICRSGCRWGKASQSQAQSQSHRDGSSSNTFHIHIVSFFWPTRLVVGFGLRKQPYAPSSDSPLSGHVTHKKIPRTSIRRKFRLVGLA